MRLSTVFFSFSLLFSLAACESAFLWNGNATVEATYDAEEAFPSAIPLQPRRHNPCKGSFRCGTCCPFKNIQALCHEAYERIEDNWVYSTDRGWWRTGTCAYRGAGEGCGVFIKKTNKKMKGPCTIWGVNMKRKYDEIRMLGCKACGRAPQDWQPGCEVKIDYVHDCEG